MSVGRFQQDRAAVRTRVRLIKGRDQGPIGQVGKQNSLYIVDSFNAIASVGEKPSSQQRIPLGGVCVSGKLAHS